MGPAGANGLEEEDGADGFEAGVLDPVAAPALWATEELPQPFTQIKGIKAASPRATPRIRRA
jgi:hypothetical protein